MELRILSEIPGLGVTKILEGKKETMSCSLDELSSHLQIQRTSFQEKGFESFFNYEHRNIEIERFKDGLSSGLSFLWFLGKGLSQIQDLLIEVNVCHSEILFHDDKNVGQGFHFSKLQACMKKVSKAMGKIKAKRQKFFLNLRLTPSVQKGLGYKYRRQAFSMLHILNEKLSRVDNLLKSLEDLLSNLSLMIATQRLKKVLREEFLYSFKAVLENISRIYKKRQTLRHCLESMLIDIKVVKENLDAAKIFIERVDSVSRVLKSFDYRNHGEIFFEDDGILVSQERLILESLFHDYRH